MRMIGRILVCLLLLVVGGALAGGLIWQRYTAPGPAAAPVAVVIPRGAGLEEIARRLAEAGLIGEPRIFAIGATVDGNHRPFKWCEFEFPARASPQQVAELIVLGRTIQRRLTVPEGLTNRQVMQLIARAEGLEGEISPRPEGSLMPDTWFYSWGDSRDRFVERQRQAMTRLLQESWRQRTPGLPLKTPQEALILASIVEKETGRAEDRPLVASVFQNRLRIGMLLQTDPTVIYGLGEGFDGNLRKRDLLAVTPYNTYTRPGLPPTPIAMPGLASLRAAVSAPVTDAFYFVGRGDGTSHFSRSLEEHNRAVAKYQSRR